MRFLIQAVLALARALSLRADAVKAIIFALLVLDPPLAADAADSPQVTVKALASFEKERAPEWLSGESTAAASSGINLVLVDGAQRYEIPWQYRANGKLERLFPVRLTVGEAYKFTIVEEDAAFGIPADSEERFGIPASMFAFKRPVLVRVERRGHVLYDREMCEVHHEKMQRKEVPIVYGLSLPPEGRQPTEKEYRSRFPNDSERSFGGCGGGPWTMDRIYVCEKCKAAHAQWVKRNTPTAK